MAVPHYRRLRGRQAGNGMRSQRMASAGGIYFDSEETAGSQITLRFKFARLK
jgi:hypothetical protein